MRALALLGDPAGITRHPLLGSAACQEPPAHFAGGAAARVLRIPPGLPPDLHGADAAHAGPSEPVPCWGGSKPAPDSAQHPSGFPSAGAEPPELRDEDAARAFPGQDGAGHAAAGGRPQQ